MSRLELQGQRFGRLSVLGRAQTQPGQRNAMWTCLCDCGKTTVVAASNLQASTRSCGCLKTEAASKILKTARYTQTHGMSHTPEHDTWLHMKQRCYNPNSHKFAIYGARGIKICDRWLNSFEAFYADMGPKPAPIYSIDRINSNGNYEPGNCRWSTPAQQSRNRSITNLITVDDKTLCVRDWHKALGIPDKKLYEMTRSRNGNQPKYKTIEAAIKALIKS